VYKWPVSATINRLSHFSDAQYRFLPATDVNSNRFENIDISSFAELTARYFAPAERLSYL